MNDLISASLVYDGGDTVTIPQQLGTPRHDQMQGTAAERLCELAGRSCYDSLGRGRPSFSGNCHECSGTGMDHPASAKSRNTDDDTCPACRGTGKAEGYHDHIAAVGHGSVWEHFNFTVAIYNRKAIEAAEVLLNRPGIFVHYESDDIFRLTVNLRSVNEWDAFSKGNRHDTSTLSNCIGTMLWDHAHKTAPHVVSRVRNLTIASPDWRSILVEPRFDEEKWITLYLAGSRGFSHEQVRHGDFTAISQRSTRYCDESEGEWVEHPLLSLWLASDDDANLYELCDGTETEEAAEDLSIADEEGSLLLFVRQMRDGGCRGGVVRDAQMLYDAIVTGLQRWLKRRGVEATTARKQARGAARGYLGNSLATEMLFSASVAQWKRMIGQRGTVHADAEIRKLYCKVLPELQRSRYGDCFADLRLARSPDGIGSIIVASDYAGDAT